MNSIPRNKVAHIKIYMIERLMKIGKDIVNMIGSGRTTIF